MKNVITKHTYPSAALPDSEQNGTLPSIKNTHIKNIILPLYFAKFG